MAQVQINLLTREFRGAEDSVAGRVVKWAAVAGVATMLTIGALQYAQYYLVSSEVADQQIDLDRSKKKVEELKGITALDDGVKKFQALIQGARDSQLSTGSALSAIQTKTPAGITISSLVLRDGGADLAVEANSLADVEKFLDSLRQDKTLSGVELQSLNQESGKPASAQIHLNFAKGGQSK